jgi:hypothetical protein
MFSLNYYKGFSVLRTFSIEETAFFIDDFWFNKSVINNIFSLKSLEFIL